MRSSRSSMGISSPRLRDTMRRMETAIHSLRTWREETMACQEPTESRLECKEPTTEDMEAEHWEVHAEEAAMKSSGALKTRHIGRNLAAEPMERIRGNCGSRKKLTAVGMMTHRAKVARRKGHGLQRQGKNNVAPKTTKRRTFGKKCWNAPQCKIVIKNPGTRRQLRLKIERISEGFDRKVFGLEFVRRATGIPSGLRKARERTVWTGRPTLERKNKDRTLWRSPPPPKRNNLLALLGYEEPEL
jgi:hypothetical protein